MRNTSDRHPLRGMVRDTKNIITDIELDEVANKLPMDSYLDNEEYEYNGNFIISKDLVSYEEFVNELCCGIITKTVETSNGETIYFAFDYGH